MYREQKVNRVSVFRSSMLATSAGLLLLFFLIQETKAAEIVDILDKRDVLDKAVLAVADTQVDANYGLNVALGDQLTYDDNIYRLPSSLANLTGVVGAGAVRDDRINSASAAVTDQWDIDKQSVSLDIEAAYNHFFHATDLSNVSSVDQLVWDWRAGEQFSGQVGADYSRFLSSFVNSNFFGKDIFQRSDFWGAGRYQVGPHVGTFAGLLYTDHTFSASELRQNDYRTKAVDFGVDLATGIKDSFGFAYRYTDARYPTSSLLNGIAFDPDYREERTRIFALYAFSEKTLLDGTVGYLKRTYPSTAIGSFSGTNWRVAVQWDATEKIRLVVEARRDLDAYLSSQTDYYVSKSYTISPTWSVTEKVGVSLAASWDDQDYIGTSSGFSSAARRDRVTSEKVSVVYKLIETINLTGAYNNENRDSNQSRFQYKDRIVSASLNYKFR